MLNFFRINDPYRLLFIFLIIILVRLPFFFAGHHIGYPLVEWMVIGEKMGDGFSMYGDIYHYIGPLSAGVYWLIDLIFGKSPIVYHIAGIILVFLQASIFNVFLINRKAYNENTYIPALIYVVLMFTFFDFINLSPVLMGLVFVILAFDLTFRHIEGRSKRDWIVLYVGIYLGIATLFYLPLFLFLISTIIVLIFFTNTMARRYLLLLYGFLVPLALIFVYSYLKGNIRDLYTCYIYSLFLKREYILMDWKSIVTIGVIPAIFVFLSVIRVFSRSIFINYQIRLQNFMIIIIFMGLLIWLIDFYKPPYLWVILVPSGAFFITHYFLLLRKRWIADMMFILLFIIILFQNYTSYFSKSDYSELINTDNYLIRKEDHYDIAENKKVLNLDYDRKIYLTNKLATPYLNLELSSLQFNKLDYYDNLSRIYGNFYRDPPEVIIDKNDWMSGLFEKMPLLESEYEKRQVHLYFRKQ